MCIWITKNERLPTPKASRVSECWVANLIVSSVCFCACNLSCLWDNLKSTLNRLPLLVRSLILDSLARVLLSVSKRRSNWKRKGKRERERNTCYDKSEVFPHPRGSCGKLWLHSWRRLFLYMCAHYCLTFLKHLSVVVTNLLKHRSFYDKPVWQSFIPFNAKKL